MTNPTLTPSQIAIARIEGEVRQLRQRVGELEQQIASLREPASTPIALLTGPRRATLRDTITDTLRSSGRAMTVKQIMSRNRGINKASMYAMLSMLKSDGLIASPGRGIYQINQH